MDNGGGSGRIFRIVPESFKEPKRPQLGTARTYDLVAALANPDGWHRDTAARLLFERRDPTAPALLTNMLNNSRAPQARVQALHALEGMNGLTEAVLLKGLRDPDERIREQSVALCQKLIAGGKMPEKIWSLLSSLSPDPSVRVRYQRA